MGKLRGVNASAFAFGTHSYFEVLCSVLGILISVGEASRIRCVDDHRRLKSFITMKHVRFLSSSV